MLYHLGCPVFGPSGFGADPVTQNKLLLIRFIRTEVALDSEQYYSTVRQEISYVPNKRAGHAEIGKPLLLGSKAPGLENHGNLDVGTRRYALTDPNASRRVALSSGPRFCRGTFAAAGARLRHGPTDRALREYVRSGSGARCLHGPGAS